MSDMSKGVKGSVIGGMILISIGILWILNNIGFINYDVTSMIKSLFDLWPLFLIAMGLNIIFKSNRMVKTVVWLIFIFSIFVNSIFIHMNGSYRYDMMGRSFPGGEHNMPKSDVLVGEKLTDAESFPFDYLTGKPYVATASISLGKGEINTGVDSKDLFSYVATNAKINKKEVYTGPEARLDLNYIEDSSENAGYSFYFSDVMDWNVNINSELITGELDFSDISLDRLKLKSGMKDLELILGEKTSRVDLSGTFEDVTVIIPSDLGLKLKSESLENINVYGKSLKDKGYIYKSDDYKDKKTSVNITVSGKVKNLNIVKSSM